jgi:CRISPR-associated protein Cmr5
MNRQIENLIPFALESAELLKNEKGKIPNEYSGYIASFGASVIQAGLKPAIAFSERKSSKSSEDRSKLMEAVCYIIMKQKGDNPDLVDDSKSLLKYVLKYESAGNTMIKDYVLDAATALKLAIRTFEFEPKEELL